MSVAFESGEESGWESGRSDGEDMNFERRAFIHEEINELGLDE